MQCLHTPVTSFNIKASPGTVFQRSAGQLCYINKITDGLPHYGKWCCKVREKSSARLSQWLGKVGVPSSMVEPLIWVLLTCMEQFQQNHGKKKHYEGKEARQQIHPVTTGGNFISPVSVAINQWPSSDLSVSSLAVQEPSSSAYLALELVEFIFHFLVHSCPVPLNK